MLAHYKRGLPHHLANRCLTQNPGCLPCWGLQTYNGYWPACPGNTANKYQIMLLHSDFRSCLLYMYACIDIKCKNQIHPFKQDLDVYICIVVVHTVHKCVYQVGHISPGLDERRMSWYVAWLLGGPKLGAAGCPGASTTSLYTRALLRAHAADEGVAGDHGKPGPP